LREAHGGRRWLEWDAPLVRREPKSLEEARARLGNELRYHDFVQWLFARQWEAVRRPRRGARRRPDGRQADLRQPRQRRLLGAPGAVLLGPRGPSGAGGRRAARLFLREGQLWGNPLYRWDEHKRTGFAWWVARLKAYAERFDAVRLDHFIAFRNYWEIPAGEKTAIDGAGSRRPATSSSRPCGPRSRPWKSSPRTSARSRRPSPLLRDKFSFLGMKLAQFSFGGGENEWPDRWPENCVGYTGTHDNDTTRGWYEDDGTLNAGRKPEAGRQGARGVPPRRRAVRGGESRVGHDAAGLALARAAGDRAHAGPARAGRRRAHEPPRLHGRQLEVAHGARALTCSLADAWAR